MQNRAGNKASNKAQQHKGSNNDYDDGDDDVDEIAMQCLFNVIRNFPLWGLADCEYA